MNRLQFQDFIASRLANHNAWVSSFLDESSDVGNFPHQIDPKAEGVVLDESYASPHPSRVTWEPSDRTSPSYLITMPHYVAKVGDQNSISRIVKLVIEESFTANKANEVASRVLLVLGQNRRQSIDSERNQLFIDSMQKTPRVNGIDFITFAFFWDARWHKSVSCSRLYSKERCFRLLKALDSRAAAKVADAFDSMKCPVPYQRLREKVKNEPSVVKASKEMVEMAPNAPLYLTLLDSDASSLRIGDDGLFTSYDRLIADTCPDVISTGYRPNKGASLGMQVGVELDMAIRSAMAKVFPTSPYYPEPNMIVRVPKKGLKSLSFLGAGSRLESRRLIENGLAIGAFKVERMFFYPIGAVATDTTRLSNGTINRVQNKDSKEYLKALHGIGQTHSFPKQWAEQLYLALGIRCRVTDCTQALIKIYNTYDLIHLATHFSAAFGERYHRKDYRTWMEIYPKYVKCLENNDSETFALCLFNKKTDPKQFATAVQYFKTKKDDLDKAYNALKKLDITPEVLAKIKLVAIECGEAIFNVLQKD